LSFSSFYSLTGVEANAKVTLSFVFRGKGMETQNAQGRRVWFRDWAEVLGREPIPPHRQANYRRWIIQYLGFCKAKQFVVCKESAQAFAAEPEVASAADLNGCKQALNWFFRRAGERMAAGRLPLPPALAKDVPPPAESDLGQTEWERRLIEVIRTRQLLWRTEQTYRMWAWRFAQFLDKTPVASAGGDDIRRFLTHLATRERIAAGTQRQALNALVFLLQEAYGKELGDFSGYAPARRWMRIPDVLTVDECLGLFGQLTGTTRLMAELMYGSGLRLLELLRLRVKDVDLVRGLITVRGGKGDKSGSGSALEIELSLILIKYYSFGLGNN
jgi:hypothetical protein